MQARSAPSWLVHTLVALALSVLFVGSMAAVRDTSISVSAAPPASEAQIRARLPELIAFVETERGLKMRRQVPVQVLADADFTRMLEDGGPVGATGPDATGAALGIDEGPSARAPSPRSSRATRVALNVTGTQHNRPMCVAGSTARSRRASARRSAQGTAA